MAKIEKFEDLESWQKCRELCKKVYLLTRKGKFSKDYTPVGQVRASSGSSMDNIAEGFERGGNKEFIHFLSISRGSPAELRSQLYRALDQNYIDMSEFQDCYTLSLECTKLVTGLIHYLKNSEFKGLKFK